MSWQASAWAANVPHGLVGYVAFRALTLLANDAKEDGTATWLEASTVAARLGVSKRTAERGYEELRNAGLIRYGDQAHVAHLPADKRPPVYDLTMAPAELLGLQVTPERRGGPRAIGPSKMTARAARQTGPSNLTGPTAVVAVNKEEPSVKTLTTQRNQQTAHARGGRTRSGSQLSAVGAVCERGHLLLEGARSCEFGHYMPGVTLHGTDEGSPAAEAVDHAAGRGGAA